ncbi:MAG: hypothetical protein M1830_007328 [Pleopsidium flavum]|nr:MAG: hypothetical protein M1830_007328 [Pleopsidium flavum]
MINNFIKLLVIPGWMLRLGPSSWRVLHASFDDVGDLLKEIMDTQIRKQTLRKDGYQSQVTQKSILGELVRSGGMVIGDADDKPDKEQRNEVIATMTREEVLGNTFILALAGSRTTADSLLYSFVLLAMHPNVQKWLHEEIDNALSAEDEDPAQWRYETLFPKLIAPLCVMMETLRVYPSAVAIPKWTGEASHNIMIEGQSYLIPSRTMVNLSLNGLQFNPKYWGPAPRSYRPQNWDTRCECHWNSNGADEKSNKVIDNFSTPPTTPFATIRTPLEGSYMPFSDGARGCLGKRFSQVEFAAVMTVVLRNHTVELGVGAGETVEAVRQRTSDILEGSLSHLTLSMQKQVPLRFVERQQKGTLRGARSS